MFIFLRLILAHFLGDFPLQFNIIYKLKFKGLKGILPHAVIVACCCVIFSWPYLQLPSMWLFILLIGTTHLFQDSFKLSYSHIKYSFWAYLLDQLIHAAIIALVFFTDLKKLAPPEYSFNPLVVLYNSNALVLYFIAVFIVTYNGFYLIRSFKNTFFGNVEKHHDFDKWYGMLERTGVISVFFCGGYFFLILPFMLVARPLIFMWGEKRMKLDAQFASPAEAALSWAVALLTGAGLYFALRKF